VKFRDLPELTFAQRLRSSGIVLDFGVARARFTTEVAAVAAPLQAIYGEFPSDVPDEQIDMSVALHAERGRFGLTRARLHFIADGRNQPFAPFPMDSPMPLLEWGLNWCVLQRCNHNLMLHAGVVERDGVAVILPAVPGSGKSTLVAALMHRGFRLLSDEFGVVDPKDHWMIPSVRPVSLKNNSVSVIASFAPASVIGPVAYGTRKGDVAHVAPTAESVAARGVKARAGVIVFPRYQAGAPTTTELVPKPRAFTKLTANAFNYQMLGPESFKAVSTIIRETNAYRLEYSDLDSAIDTIGKLVAAAVH
jgi:HprK-related kinase A